MSDQKKDVIRGDDSLIDPGSANIQRNIDLVVRHFAAFVNDRDLAAIDRNMAAEFLDHDGPGGKNADRAGDKALMNEMHRLFPDLRVDIRDVVAQDDKVVVRNVWTCTHASTGQRLEFHGFVLWRIADDRIVERWATVTPLHEIAAQCLNW